MANGYKPLEPMEGQHKVRISVNKVEFNNQKINAIKSVRSITGWGLKESKDFVEDICGDPANKNNGESVYVFVVPTFLEDIAIVERFNPFNITIFPVGSSTGANGVDAMPVKFKGCFNMVSAGVIHLYLENGDENKLSMNVPADEMQDIIQMFLKNCI